MIVAYPRANRNGRARLTTRSPRPTRPWRRGPGCVRRNEQRPNGAFRPAPTNRIAPARRPTDLATRVEAHGVHGVRVAQGVCERLFTLRDHGQMNVVGHPAVGPDFQSAPGAVFLQEPPIGMPVLVRLNGIRPPVSPLRDMMRIPRHHISRDPAHKARIVKHLPEDKLIRSLSLNLP